jgi:hypothetical protein
MTIEFKEFPKTPRLHKCVIVTEKIDGTNAAVVVSEIEEHRAGLNLVNDNELRIVGRLVVAAQSRSRLLTLKDDNFGFARWVQENAEELVLLGVGCHFGEWWGSGIQRGYGLPKGEKRFSLFNVDRWCDQLGARPKCCHVVPTLAVGDGFEHCVPQALHCLQLDGSHAAPGFKNPEGVMAFHTASRSYFKRTFKGDAHKCGGLE